MTVISRSTSALPPLSDRIAEGRPVFTRDQAMNLMKRVRSMSTLERTTVTMQHTVRSITQLANDRIRSTDDGEVLRIGIMSKFGPGNAAFVTANQLDDKSLRELVNQAEALAKGMSATLEKLHVEVWDEQDTYAPGTIWHDATASALQSARETAIPQMIDVMHRQQFRISGFVGTMARSEAVLRENGIHAFSEETDCELSVTARSADGKSSGWAGASARDWTKIAPGAVAAEAAEIAKMNMNPQALEPGRRTAILGPAAVMQLMRFFCPHFDGSATDEGRTGFSRVPGQMEGNRIGQRMFDPRIKITSNPADPDGGYKGWFDFGYANHPMTWVENGVLKNLGYSTGAVSQNKPYSELPFGLRLHGGDTTIEQMIKQCEEGIYVNRLSGVDIIDRNSGMLSGVTRDGCFFVKDGKINRPVKDFRFLTSPFFILNNLVALGPTRRGTFGYSPATMTELDMTNKGNDMFGNSFFDWPRWPMIVPPMMVRDFNFNALSDAV